MNLWESVKELICLCERVDFVHLYAQRKLIFVQKLFQSARDVLHTCAYMYTLSSECTSLCEKFDVYISNFNINNAKAKITHAVRNEFCSICSLCRC